MIWKGLGLITNTESPIVVVLRHVFSSPQIEIEIDHVLCCSGSMEPAFYRGDLLFLTNPVDQKYHTGDITVYKIPGADIPIVHRVLETHNGAKIGKRFETWLFTTTTINLRALLSERRFLQALSRRINCY